MTFAVNKLSSNKQTTGVLLNQQPETPASLSHCICSCGNCLTLLLEDFAKETFDIIHDITVFISIQKTGNTGYTSGQQITSENMKNGAYICSIHRIDHE